MKGIEETLLLGGGDEIELQCTSKLLSRSFSKSELWKIPLAVVPGLLLAGEDDL